MNGDSNAPPRLKKTTPLIRWVLVAVVIDLWVSFTRLLIWWPTEGLMEAPWVRTQWARFIYEGMNGGANGTGNDVDDWQPR